MFQYLTFDDFYAHLPPDWRLIGVEFPHEKSVPLPRFTHPECCVYLPGAEDYGLSKQALEKCHRIIYAPSQRCLNVAVAGSLIMYDRMVKSAE